MASKTDSTVSHVGVRLIYLIVVGKGAFFTHPSSLFRSFSVATRFTIVLGPECALGELPLFQRNGLRQQRRYDKRTKYDCRQQPQSCC